MGVSTWVNCLFSALYSPFICCFCPKACEALSLQKLVKFWDNVEHFHCVSVPQPLGVANVCPCTASSRMWVSQWFVLLTLLVKGIKKILYHISIIISVMHLFMKIHCTTHSLFLHRKGIGNISSTDNGYKGICKWNEENK